MRYGTVGLWRHEILIYTELNFMPIEKTLALMCEISSQAVSLNSSKNFNSF